MEIKKYETIDEIFVGPMGIIYKMTIKKKKMKKKNSHFILPNLLLHFFKILKRWFIFAMYKPCFLEMLPDLRPSNDFL